MILIFPMYQVLIFVCKKLFFGKKGDIDLPTVSGNLNSFARVCLSLSLSLSLCLSLSLSLSLSLCWRVDFVRGISFAHACSQRL